MNQALIQNVIHLTNTTGEEITFTIMPGMWFLPGSGDYQPMLIVKAYIITIMSDHQVTHVIPVFVWHQISLPLTKPQVIPFMIWFHKNV